MRFLVLGPLEVSEEGGDQLAIAGAKERTILAHLIARAGQVVSVDDLIEELWGGEPPALRRRPSPRTSRGFGAIFACAPRPTRTVT